MNFWDERFKEFPQAYGTDVNDFLKDHLDLFDHPKGKVLSLGEGQGRNALFLASKGYDVIALDYSQIALEQLIINANQLNLKLETVLADLTLFNLEELKQVTHIYSIWCHLPSVIRKKVHQSIEKMLPQGGIYLIESYTKEQLKYNTGGPKDLDLLLSKQELLNDFRAMEVISCEEKIRTIKEGTFHQGESAVLQAILKKQ
jgi:SAM-dependent methyltransferase